MTIIWSEIALIIIITLHLKLANISPVCDSTKMPGQISVQTPAHPNQSHSCLNRDINDINPEDSASQISDTYTLSKHEI